ncbi:ATP-dependent zinc metalloprotease FtsH [Fundicoccus culcitae]|uniref:ATP-dependent zinc metalloprotease FtsH n=1 Tax=Fundicoccus culcitae TaxID=2969821 RepID=A0ABY5P585_9LACT|nr:ATP-dependent zinc metalloprotease FtsH [Fundicoccus culcitae]UUX33588.1 ATP-dependent zinc metalloprotease FtsH [Fundicoccus culcitae]
MSNFEERDNQNERKPLIYYWGLVMLGLFLLNIFIVPWAGSRQVQEVDYNTFVTMLGEGQVTAVEVQEQDNQIVFAGENGVYKTGMVEDPMLTERLLNADVEFSGQIIEQASPLVAFLVSWVLPMLLMYLFWRFISKRMTERMGGGEGSNAMSFGMTKSNAKVYVQSTEGISFDDVAGQDEAKESLSEIVDYMHNPDKYQSVGAKMPTGVLLVGPPGTGKTMLARAVAGEANVPFFSISGSEFVEMFAGAGAARVRDLFKQAKEKAPCIVFIDEIDAVGKKRSNQAIGNDEREQTLNQLLTEMDGFEGNTGVMILAATNQPEALDNALLRPGRFDRQVRVELPDLIGREEILKVHAKNIQHESNVDFNKIARMASGASGAELANIVNEAALRAVREGRQKANQEDFQESIEVVIAGAEKKNAILSDKEKMIVSYHEVGHALVAALQTHSAPVEKITIIPRTSGALGYTMQVSEGNDNLLSKEQLMDKLAVYAGGRAAEEVVFGSVTTGASNDIEQMTKIARAMITQYGMDNDIGMVTFEQNQSQYLSNGTNSSASPEMQSKIDRAIVELIQERYDYAKQLLTDNRTLLDSLSQHLYETETITGAEFMEILEKENKEDIVDETPVTT